MSLTTDPTQMASQLVRLEEITPASEYAAYFSVPLAPLVAHLGLRIFNGYDDLDDLQFAFLTLPSGETVTLTEYAGDPKTSLCVDLEKQQTISQIILDSCRELKVSPSEIEWIYEDWREEVERLYAEQGEVESINRSEPQTILPLQESEPIECFYYALEIYPRERIPEYWAMLQHNLGLAYYHRSIGERWRNLQESIACFNRSLEVFTEDDFPQKWQINQEDLDRSQAEWKIAKNNLIRDILDRASEIYNLLGADLSEADLYGAIMYKTLLIRASLYGADLSKANLLGANLYKAELIRANLYKANLSEACLYGAKLSNANLLGANLSKADLSEAYLLGTDLSESDLSEAYLSGADLRGANLHGANVKKTRFGRNKGISESMREDLISRGAKFDDFPGDRSAVQIPVPC